MYQVAMRLPCSRIAWTTKLTCDFLYLVIACATHLLNGPMKWGERKKYSQTIGLMKRSRCEWDWTLSYRLALGSMSDPPILIYRPVTGIASALTYGQFTGWRCATLQPLGSQSDPVQRMNSESQLGSGVNTRNLSHANALRRHPS